MDKAISRGSGNEWCSLGQKDICTLSLDRGCEGFRFKSSLSRHAATGKGISIDEIEVMHGSSANSRFYRKMYSIENVPSVDDIY